MLFRSVSQSRYQAAQADLARMLQAAQGQTSLGSAQTAAAQAEAQKQMAIAQGRAGLAESAEGTNLKNIAALQAMGEEEARRNQAAIDASKTQFTEGQNAPFANIGAATNIANAVPGNQAGTTNSQSQQPGPSTAATIAGLGLGAAGAAKAFAAKGGAIRAKKPFSRVSYGNIPQRGLGMFKRAS